MTILQTLQNSNDPRLQMFRAQRDGEARKQGLMIVDSAKVVERLIKTGKSIRSILAPENFFVKNHSLLEGQEGLELYKCTKDIMESIVGHRIHSGVIALAERPQDVPLNQLDDRIIFLNGVNNSENVGAILRNALAFGARSICVDPQSCSPFLRRSIRVSMGSVFKCKVHHCQDTQSALRELKQLGYSLFAANLSKTSVELSQILFPPRSVVLIGCEGDGISQDALDLVDQEIHIQMDEGIDSLNAAVASGIILHRMAVSKV